jgi:hypothetical protein
LVVWLEIPEFPRGFGAHFPEWILEHRSDKSPTSYSTSNNAGCSTGADPEFGIVGAEARI